jgi:hypothetical protein
MARRSKENGRRLALAAVPPRARFKTAAPEAPIVSAATGVLAACCCENIAREHGNSRKGLLRPTSSMERRSLNSPRPAPLTTALFLTFRPSRRLPRNQTRAFRRFGGDPGDQVEAPLLERKPRAPRSRPPPTHNPWRSKFWDSIKDSIRAGIRMSGKSNCRYPGERQPRVDAGIPAKKYPQREFSTLAEIQYRRVNVGQ